MRRLKIFDASWHLLAIRINGDWIDPYGGIFSAKDVRDFDSLAAVAELAKPFTPDVAAAAVYDASITIGLPGARVEEC
jgi:hypothetical protein